MSNGFPGFFPKQHTTVPTHAPSVAPAPYSSPYQGPVFSASTFTQQSTSNLAPPNTFKNTAVFTSGIASNAEMPWVKFVAESVIQIIQRLDTMKLNEEACREFDDFIKTFLFTVTHNGGQIHNEELIENFKRQVQSIQAKIPAPQNPSHQFIDPAETMNIITRLKQDLQSAVQLFQTGLQLSVVASMEEFKVWRAGIENNISGNIIRQLTNQTYNTNNNFRLRSEATGDVSLTTQGSQFKTGRNFNQYTRAANVTEKLENSTVEADGDIDLTAIATGTTGMRFA